MTLDLTWPETIGIVAGTGAAAMWAKATYTRASSGAATLDTRLCGSLLPMMTTSAVAGGLQASVQIPPSAFDQPSIPVTRLAVTQRDDRSLTFALSTVLGAMLPELDVTWPSTANLVLADHDGDGSPGVTALPIEGPEFAQLPTSISQLEFLDRLYLAFRGQLRVSIMPACSGTTNGVVEPLGFNFSLVGCHVKDRDECTASELRFMANQGLNFTLGKSGTWTEAEVPDDASCADVRAALPMP